MEGTHEQTPLLNKYLSYNCLHLQLSIVLLNPDWIMLFNLATKVQNIILNITSYTRSKSSSTTEASKTYIKHKKMRTCQYFHPIEVFQVPIKVIC